MIVCSMFDNIAPYKGCVYVSPKSDLVGERKSVNDEWVSLQNSKHCLIVQFNIDERLRWDQIALSLDHRVQLNVNNDDTVSVMLVGKPGTTEKISISLDAYPNLKLPSELRYPRRPSRPESFEEMSKWHGSSSACVGGGYDFYGTADEFQELSVDVKKEMAKRAMDTYEKQLIEYNKKVDEWKNRVHNSVIMSLKNRPVCSGYRYTICVNVDAEKKGYFQVIPDTHDQHGYSLIGDYTQVNIHRF